MAIQFLPMPLLTKPICHSWDGFYSLSDKQKDFFLSDKSPYRSENSNSSYIAKRLQELDEKTKNTNDITLNKEYYEA